MLLYGTLTHTVPILIWHLRNHTFTDLTPQLVPILNLPYIINSQVKYLTLAGRVIKSKQEQTIEKEQRYQIIRKSDNTGWVLQMLLFTEDER